MSFWELVFAHPVASFFLLIGLAWLISSPIQAWRQL